MGEKGEGAAADFTWLKEPREKENASGGGDSSGAERGDSKEDKKRSDAILEELFSSIQNLGSSFDVAEAITEESRSKKERATREKSRSRSRSRDRKHKHKKNKKERKHKKHRSRSRSRSNDRKKRHRSASSSPSRVGKTGTLADIKMSTKAKNLEALKHTVPVTSLAAHAEDEDDLPVGADYRTVMAEAVATSQPSTSHDQMDLPTEPPVPKKVAEPPFPLKKSDGERKESSEGKSSPMLKKVISEKGGAQLVPRKIQIESTKANGNSSADTFGPAPPPAPKVDEPKDDEGEIAIAPQPLKTTPHKITFGVISLKVNGATPDKGEEKKEEITEEKKEVKKEEKKEAKKEEKKDVKKEEKQEVKKEEKVEVKKEVKEEDDRMEVDGNVGKKVKSEDKEKKASKKLANRRRRSSSVDNNSKRKKEEKKERKRSRSRSRSRDRRRDMSRDNGRDRKRERSRSKDRRDTRKDDRRRRSKSRSVERRREERDRDRDRRSRRSRSREIRRGGSRERSKSREKIDKKKLLEIALQNSKGGGAPSTTEKQGVNMKILEKAGGRNIGDIVSYCQKLSETEKEEKVGGRGDSDEDDFSYKSKKEIKMNIPGSKQLPISTPQERLLETVPLRAAFPVSSGVIHRDTEKPSEWRKVETSTTVPSVCTPVQKKLVATSSLSKIKAESEGKFVAPSSFPILPPPPAPPTLRADLIPPPPPPPNLCGALMPPPPMPPTIITPSYDRLIQMPESGREEVSK